jgi:1-acyl-sn-glycerol-3-phosphate acyltransferase
MLPHMGIVESLRVVAAMAKVTAPTVFEIARGDGVARHDVDNRTRWFGQRVVDILNIDLVVRGGESLDPRTAYVYLANHQSHLDIPILFASLPSRTIRMLGKAELFRIPLWGRGLRAAEFIEVDRSNHEKAIASIDRAKELVRDGVSVFVAPEGTRSRDGRIGPLKKGGFHLSIDTGAPIVPVAIRGTLQILPRGGRTMRTGQRVSVDIGDPISSQQPIDQLMVTVGNFLRDHVENSTRI